MTEVWIFRVGSLGDALVSLPAVHRVREKFPTARLVLLTNQDQGSIVNAWDVLRHSGVFAEAVQYQPRQPDQVLKLLWQLRSRRPDHLYYLAPARTPAQTRRDRYFFHALGGIKHVWGLDDAEPHRPRQPASWTDEPDIKEAQRLLTLVDSKATLSDFHDRALLTVPDADAQAAHRALEAGGWRAGERLVVMVPGSKMQAKRWPIERYVAVAQALLQAEPHLKIAVLGSPDEAPLAVELQASLGPRCLNLAGATNLMEAAGVLALACLYVGNDTGTMHLAAAMKTPGVAIFSARDRAGKWEPFGSRFRVLRADVACRGCMLQTCVERDIACLRAISQEEVIAAGLAELSQPSTPVVVR